ncbi:UDP-N-acetylglucosamine--N-acetylmuramyl-(pentapeptide) pyrophosphoryl-undecaprenol N-acetylglucosamine transferase [Ilumatobacter sp.]|uniref:UDP-N-acetylglucosamine--N-acetylmuramyl- (pentapeptide) pyrophosphoryl-undecaprenol N-acetylglucosamine transferase n=1 Tax=Ilumatobacter sp. TaxID=1967498 RepID=UPI003B528E68
MTESTGPEPDDPGCFAVVTGGGTAGHVLPALAVAEALVAAGRAPGEIHYVGSRRGIETRLVPETGHGRTFLDVVGVQRSLSRRNLAFLPKMLRARRAALGLLRELRPRVVVSVGGYASLPAVLAARSLGIPVVVVSYDRRPGRASQLAARFAAASAVAFEGSSLPRAVVTGAPIRRSVLQVDRDRDRTAARRRLGLPVDRFVVAVMGGSLGSGVLNAQIDAHLREHRADAGLAVRQVAGERFVDDVARIEPPDGSDGVLHQVIGYESDMAAVYAAADLLVGRGGASTVHEVAVTGVPSVLVPWSGAADDHQRGNVEWLREVGGAVMLGEGELGRLGAEIERLRADPDARRALERAARARGEVHRSGAMAGLIERVAVVSGG